MGIDNDLRKFQIGQQVVYGYKSGTSWGKNKCRDRQKAKVVADAGHLDLPCAMIYYYLVQFIDGATRKVRESELHRKSSKREGAHDLCY